MIIKTERQEKKLSELGIIASYGLNIFLSMVEPGMTGRKIDNFAYEFFKANNVDSAPLKAYGFPGNICISVNETAAHGIPDDYIFQNGDMVNVDVSIHKDDVWVDTGMSIVCGKGSAEQLNLLKATREARREAIAAAKPDSHVRDIAAAVGAVAAKYGVGVVDNLGGHGVGDFIHEPPYISNVTSYVDNHVLRAGEVIAIEPILSYQNCSVLKSGAWHLNSPTQSAQAEHTIIVGTTTKIIT